MITLMRDCWLEDPKLRPDFKHIRVAVKQMNRNREGNLLDHAIKMMERYAADLETQIADRTRELNDETAKADLLLYKFLPRHVADRLKAGMSVEPETLDLVTIVFCDVADFNHLASGSTPAQLVNLLNDLYSNIDAIVDEYECFKVQTVNDTYMIACGLQHNADSLKAANGKNFKYSQLNW